MRIGRLLILLAIIVILAIAAVWALTNLGGDGDDSGAAETTDIVMVVQPIPRGNQITAEALEYLPFPSDQLIPNMFTSIDSVVGTRARYDLEPGVPLTDNMVVGADGAFTETGSDSALLIPAGMVAFPIPIDRFSSMGYGLRDGDHVNVIATMLLVDLNPDFQTILPDNTGAVIGPGNNVLVTIQEGESVSSQIIVDELVNALTAQIATGGVTSPQGQAVLDPVLSQPFYLVPSEAQRPRLVSQTLLQDVVILHMGNFPYTDENGQIVEDAYQPVSPGVDASGESIAAGPKDPPDIVTLIVTPQDAVTLNYLLYAGADLSLALRPNGDDSVAATEAVTLDFLLTNYDIPVPNKLPYGLEPRLDVLVPPGLQIELPEEPQQ